MIILKCKMCGADLDPQDNSTVCECDYCGTKQTIPAVDDEKKLKLYDRANRLRMNAEFDKAAGVYESIVADFDSEAEAYWGMLLCKYGIEYVDDPATGNKIPTCHRSSYDSIMDDAGFELVMENAADTLSRTVYRDQAKEIEEIRKGIIEVSGKEEPYDIFICYKETAEDGGRTIDSVLAQDVYDALTTKGYRVFFSRITLEDKLGTEYEPYIFAALTSAKVMLAFGTSYDYYNAVWVKNEWSRFLKLMAKDKEKHLIPCYKDIDAYDMPKEFAKLQAQDLGKIGAVQDLVRGIDKLIGKTVSAGTAEVSNNAISAPLIKRMYMFLEEGNWKSADEYAEKVLDLDPENGEAYLGKFLADQKLHRITEIVEVYLEKFLSEHELQKITEVGKGSFSYVPDDSDNIYVDSVGEKDIVGVINAVTCCAEIGFVEARNLVRRGVFSFKSRYCQNALDWLRVVGATASFVTKEAEFTNPYEGNTNYDKLMKYASSQLKIEIIQQTDGFYEQLHKKVEERKKQEEEEAKRTEEKKAEYLVKQKENKQKKAVLREQIKEKEENLEALQSGSNLSDEQQREYERRALAAEKAEDEYQNARRSLAASNSEMTINRYKAVVAEKKAILSGLGIFKGKEKKQLQAEIEELNRSIDDLEESDRKENARLNQLKKQSENTKEEAESYLQNSLTNSYGDKKRDVENQIAELKVELDKLGGDFYEFGTDYNDLPCQWIKITSDEEKTLLLSKRYFSSPPYHDEGGDITWEECSLRSYLNHEFLSEKFTADEQEAILLTNVVAHKNPDYTMVSAGRDTNDKIFLLSIEELRQYVVSKERMNCRTEWLLRSPGGRSDLVACVDKNGVVDTMGIDVGRTMVYSGCLRPAFWIKNSDIESLLN